MENLINDKNQKVQVSDAVYDEMCEEYSKDSNIGTVLLYDIHGNEQSIPTVLNNMNGRRRNRLKQTDNLSTTENSNEAPKCRGCSQSLLGKPYATGGRAYHPVTKEQCKTNYYGGHVCSSECDRRASLELEQSMPGHTGQHRLSEGSSAYRHWQNNWQR